MKKMMIVLCTALMAVTANEAQAQLRTTDVQVQTNPTDYYANRNGTYPFQMNQNNNMGTSPNNAVYKNEAAFYNKDNTVQNRFPTSNGQYFTPGSQGGNNTGNYNNNNSGNYNNGDINGRSGPIYIDNRDPNVPVKR